MDGTLRIWRLEDQECVAFFSGHRSIVPHVKFSSTDHRIVSCSYDKTLKVRARSVAATHLADDEE